MGLVISENQTLLKLSCVKSFGISKLKKKLPKKIPYKAVYQRCKGF